MSDWIDPRFHVAWAAGLLDADGSVSLHFAPSRARTGSIGRAFRWRLRVGMTDFGAVHRMHDVFGGDVTSGTPTLAGRPMWLWTISGGAAVRAARQMIPYAVTKAERLRLFVEAWERKSAIPLVSSGPGHRGGHRLADEIVPLLTDYVDAIKALNQKGPRGSTVLPALVRTATTGGVR